MSKKKSSFAFFLDHYVDEQRRKGRSITKKSAVLECGPVWNQLSENDKQIYIDLAKAFKNEQDDVKKETHHWVDPFSKTYSGGRAKPGNEITYLVSHIRHEKDLKTHNFYILHCNYYCRTEAGVYLPGEIALVEFNLEEGIRQTYHTLIDPGKVPLGYAYEARRIIGEVHGLPFPPYDEGEKNLDKVLDDVVQVVKPSEENESEFPPIFTIEENVIPATEILKRLSVNRGKDAPLNVYAIHRMFFWLKNKCTEFCGNEVGFPVLSNALSEIEKDVFRYCTGISCKYHAELPDKFQNCSLSIVQRLVYIICDHCCHHLRIKLMRGKHIHQDFLKRANDSQQCSSACDTSDLTSCPPEESDFCGASTYASSMIDDVTYRDELHEEETDEDETEEEEEEEDVTRVKGVKDSCDSEFDSDAIMTKIRGRGRAFGYVEQTQSRPGLPPS